MGFKIFVNGDILDATDVNDFLMKQSVMVFADAAARTAALPAPIEGMVTYLSDTDSLEVFTGSGFVVVNDNTAAILKAIIDAKGDLIVGTAADTPARLAVGTNGHVLTADSVETSGMKWAAPASAAQVFIASASPSSAASVNFDNVFTASFQNYLIMVSVEGSAADALRAVLRVSGSSNTTANYSMQQLLASDTTVSGVRTTNANAINIGTVGNSRQASFMYVYNPQVSSKTQFVSQGVQFFAGANAPGVIQLMGHFNLTTVFDGIGIFAATGNITGEIRIYGLEDS